MFLLSMRAQTTSNLQIMMIPRPHPFERIRGGKRYKVAVQVWPSYTSGKPLTFRPLISRLGLRTAAFQRILCSL